MTAYVSTQSGDWSNVATWGGGGYPIDGDAATVSVGHIVEVDGDITMGTNPANNTTYNLWINGTLKWPDVPTGDWTLTVKGNIYIDRGGAFTIGTDANPIPSTRTATLHFPTDTGAYEWRLFCQGEFRARGAEAFHMADTDSQRSHINGATVAGSDITFVTQDPVDWEIGDTIWCGVRGDPYNVVNNSYEKVNIKSKTNSTTYTADFVWNHCNNEQLVHENRNVVLKGGDGTHGAQLHFEQVNAVLGSQEDVVCDIQWVKLQYFSKGLALSAAIVYDLSVGTSYDHDQHIPKGHFMLVGVVLSEPGDTYGTQALYINTDVNFLDDDINVIDGFHVWNFAGATFRFVVRGILRTKNLTTMRSSHYGIENLTNVGGLYLDGYWYSSYNSGVSTSVGIRVGFVELKNFEILYAYDAIIFSFDGGKYYNNARPVVIKNGRIGRSYRGVYTLTSKQALTISDVDFDYITQAGILLSGSREVSIYNCNFNACNRAQANNSGGVTVDKTSSDVTLYNCSFGMVSRNYKANISTNYDGWGQFGSGRVLAKKCTFVEPGYPASGDYATDAMQWSAFMYNVGNVTGRQKIGPNRTMELIDPIVWNNVKSVEQWPIDYPNIDRLAFIHGGSEVREEKTMVIDNTLPMKIMVFQPLEQCRVNHVAPIKVPVSSGNTATVKLSMRKTADGLGALPGIRIVGPGFDDVAYMTPALLNTWEELTVSGVATRDGLAKLYIYAGSGIPKAGTGNTPPDIVGGDVDTGFSSVVYTDGLKVLVT